MRVVGVYKNLHIMLLYFGIICEMVTVFMAQLPQPEGFRTTFWTRSVHIISVVT